MVVVKKKAANNCNYHSKTKVELLLDEFSPEILKAFSDPPEFGSVSVKVVYHQAKPVRIECGRSSNSKVS